MSINKAILIGRLGNDPDLKSLQSGQQVANFSLATSKRYLDKDGNKQEKTEWHRIVAWGKTAELCGKYLSKGRQVYIEGSITTEEWEDKEKVKRYTTKIVAEHVTFLGSAPEGAKKEQSAPPAQKRVDPDLDDGGALF